MSLIKGQTAAAALMLVLSIIYIIIYIVTSVQVSRTKNPMINTIAPDQQPVNDPTKSPYTQPSIYNIPAQFLPLTNYPPPVRQAPGSPKYHRPAGAEQIIPTTSANPTTSTNPVQEVSCPLCKSKVPIPFSPNYQNVLTV
ncbi:unnamed protein product [Didymodactylos carnosus]|uniref:Uncharacterized protein n=1 Tax=Didymodactylos carnosus TaxID=1234261 RepID=A0A813SK15_9BILA|nr:unnamed protein product [Didymodactylos carnosus]CAF1277278.1 unnamed protein product [Didymodactylos carnosus]CAF3581412.1 unnamed protein product [Didymodactylos carnosus]CAF4082394.1 unnamed protein product [Didymodactylos carnosus]